MINLSEVDFTGPKSNNYLSGREKIGMPQKAIAKTNRVSRCYGVFEYLSGEERVLSKLNFFLLLSVLIR